ncbi:hypothetical protein D6783_02700 [Candidatus Woesearchaeota archaeon]|nr:MAG: hypothetical protein D6783_02700 [Candidatus Woesearchaeota archaeon]
METEQGDAYWVNIIGLVVGRLSERSFLVDDGTGRLLVKTGEDREDVDVGSVVLVVGLPRAEGDSRYVAGDIVKNLGDKEWLAFRRAQLSRMKAFCQKEKAEEEAEENRSGVEGVNERDKEVERMQERSVCEDLVDLIRSLDAGAGADFDEVVAKSKMKHAEKALIAMLERGELFEIKPGRVKVLE